jgi:hypothetical protein
MAKHRACQAALTLELKLDALDGPHQILEELGPFQLHGSHSLCSQQNYGAPLDGMLLKNLFISQLTGHTPRPVAARTSYSINNVSGPRQ